MLLNFKKLSIAAAAALALAACSSTDGGHEHHGHDGHKHGGKPHAEKAETKAGAPVFQCENGLAPKVMVRGDSLMLVLDEQQKTVLTRTAAASGELFAADKGLYGKRTEWHQKGSTAAFEFTDPYGNTVQTTCQG